MTIRTLADYVAGRTGHRSEVVHLDPPPSRRREVEVRHRQPGITKIQMLTGWTPTRGWRDVVDQLVAQALEDSIAPVLA